MTAIATTPLEAIAETIRAVEGVESASIWERHGKARVYIELPKLNGGKAWNNGKAGTVYYENGKIIEKGDWAGAATRRNGRELINDIETALGLPQTTWLRM